MSRKVCSSVFGVDGPMHYLCGVDMLYHERNKADDLAVSIFDPDLNIQWPFAKEEMIISERDIDSVTLRELAMQRQES